MSQPLPPGAEPLPAEVWASPDYVTRQIALIEDALTQVLFGDYDAVVQTEGGDPVWGALAMHINVVLNAVREAIERAQKSEALAEMRRTVEEQNNQLHDAMAALEAQNQQITEADRLRREMFANITHEFRTPLTLCLAPLSALMSEDSGSLTERQQYLAGIVQSNVLKLLTLINGLLDLARLDARAAETRREPVCLRRFLARMVEGFRPTADSRGLTLRTEMPESVPAVLGDAQVMEKVFANLLSNALKFTPAGGSVTLRVRVEDGELVTCIADDGIGIPATELPHVFERFRQVDGGRNRRYEGSGIGLALVRELVEQMGGSVTAHSVEGEGSEFCVRLQLADVTVDDATPPREVELGGMWQLQQRPRERRARNNTGPVSASSRKRLLLAEDNDDMAEFIVSLVEDEYEVLRAHNGREALDWMRRFDPDVVLSDMMMPEMDGFELCRALKADPELAVIPVVLLTAQADRDSVMTGWEAGADEYLVKPFEPHELRVRLRSLIRLRASHRALAARTAELEELNRQLVETQAKAVQSGKLAAVGQLAAGVAHEINNPLTTVLGFAQVLERRLPPGGPESQAVKAIVREARRSRDLVKDILDFARAAKTVHGPVDLTAALDRVRTVCGPRAQQHGVTLEFDTAGAPPTLHGDGQRLEQVLINLVNNGVDAIAPVRPDGRISLTATVSGEEVVLSVADNGPGIPPEIMDRIFEPFFTTKEPGKGTGLGLALSYEIVKQHGGQLEVENRAGGGACFTVRLPLRAGEQTWAKAS